VTDDDVKIAAYEIASRGRIQYLSDRHFTALQQLRVAHHLMTDAAECVGVDSLENAREILVKAWWRSQGFDRELLRARRTGVLCGLAFGAMLGMFIGAAIAFFFGR
jgi:SOS response regulatory protein OraA/RecX